MITSIGHRRQRDHRIVIIVERARSEERRGVSRTVEDFGYEVFDGHAETDHAEDQRDSPPETAARAKPPRSCPQPLDQPGRCELETRARVQGRHHVLVRGRQPWDPDLLYRWTLEHLHTHAERHCARFILALWNQTDYDEME